MTYYTFAVYIPFMESKNPIITSLIDRLHRELPHSVTRVILYGSRARNSHEPLSDYDLLVVLHRKDSNLVEKLDDIAGTMMLEHGAVISLLPVTEKFIDEYPFDPLLKNIDREGIVLWPKTA